MAVAAIGEANATNPELLEMATLFHYGIGHAISTCGLLLLMIRKCAWTRPKTPCSPTALAQPSLVLTRLDGRHVLFARRHGRRRHRRGQRHQP